MDICMCYCRCSNIFVYNVLTLTSLVYYTFNIPKMHHINNKQTNKTRIKTIGNNEEKKERKGKDFQGLWVKDYKSTLPPLSIYRTIHFLLFSYQTMFTPLTVFVVVVVVHFKIQKKKKKPFLAFRPCKNRW